MIDLLIERFHRHREFGRYIITTEASEDLAQWGHANFGGTRQRNRRAQLQRTRLLLPGRRDGSLHDGSRE